MIFKYIIQITYDYDYKPIRSINKNCLNKSNTAPSFANFQRYGINIPFETNSIGRVVSMCMDLKCRI